MAKDAYFTPLTRKPTSSVWSHIYIPFSSKTFSYYYIKGHYIYLNKVPMFGLVQYAFSLIQVQQPHPGSLQANHSCRSYLASTHHVVVSCFLHKLLLLGESNFLVRYSYKKWIWDVTKVSIVKFYKRRYMYEDITLCWILVV